MKADPNDDERSAVKVILKKLNVVHVPQYVSCLWIPSIFNYRCENGVIGQSFEYES